MKKWVLLLALLLANLFLLDISVKSQNQETLEQIKQKVLSGQMSIEEAKKEALKMSSKNKSKPQSISANKAISQQLIDSKQAILISPTYIEFSRKNAKDSILIYNVSNKSIHWSVTNKIKDIKLYKDNKEVQFIDGVLNPGEVYSLKYGLEISSNEMIPIEGKSYTLNFMTSNLDKPEEITIAYIPEVLQGDSSYFGYDIFRSQYKVDITDIGPSSSEYIIAAGDELILNTWGQVEMSIPIAVQANGTVFIENVGQVYVAGDKLSDVKTKLTNLMSRSYSSLKSSNGSNASTYLDLSLQKISSFPVYVVGVVNKPGMVRVNSLSTVFSALFAAGGIKQDGSLRNIEVVREGNVIAKVDLYEYLCEGSLKSDIRLSAKDVIRVPYRKSTVKIQGELYRPMIYELLENETLADLVKYAGGVKSTADASILMIDRLDPKAKNKQLRTTIKAKLGEYINNKLVINKLPIFDTDIIRVYALKGQALDFVNISGAVYREGKYAIVPNMTVGALISEAGELRDDAYRNKAELVRSYNDGTRKYFSINLNDSLSLQTKVSSMDSLKIYSLLKLRMQQKVKIEGHIPTPGEFLFSDDMSVYDLIMMGGGLEDEIFRSETYTERADLIRYNEDGVTTRVIPINLREVLEGNENANIKLEAGDKLLVYDITMTFNKMYVSIEGAVHKQGEYELQTNMTIKDIVLQAGGFQYSAYKSSVEVFRVDPFNVKQGELSVAIKIDLKDGLLSSFDINSDFKLKDRDIIVVRQYPKYQFQRKVYLNGEVMYPGTYTLLKEKESLKDLIKRAGGLSSEAYIDATEFIRDGKKMLSNFDKLMKSSKRFDIELKKGDSITIPKHPGIVTVRGNVSNPGIVQYRKGWTANDYIEAAGDYTFEAARGKTIIYYPGGAAKKRRIILGFTKVKEGCVIEVPSKKSRPATYWLDFTAKLSSVVASVVTTIYLVTR